MKKILKIAGDRYLRDVREDPLLASEVKKTRDQENSGACGSDCDQVPGHWPGPQQRNSKTFDHANHRIDRVEIPETLRNDVCGVNHGRGIHSKLNDEREGMFDISVLDRHRGEPKSYPQGRCETW